MLSGTPEFHVLDDAATNLAYRYSESGVPLGSTALVAANAAPRGAASTVAAEKTWVIDANRNVYVYNATGGLLGSWSAGSMPSKATPEGIATNGADIWIVDSKSDKVYRYAGAASRLAGSQNAASSFSLYSANWFGVTNSNPKDIVTDGAHLWVVDDGKTDRVFKYTLTGGLAGYWTIEPANKAPTGIALDPANVSHIWIVDSGTGRVYQYNTATPRITGTQSAALAFALASGNTNPQGIADPPAPATLAEVVRRETGVRNSPTPPLTLLTGDKRDRFTNSNKRLLDTHPKVAQLRDEVFVMFAQEQCRLLDNRDARKTDFINERGSSQCPAKELELFIILYTNPQPCCLWYPFDGFEANLDKFFPSVAAN
jgi:hypothetical protein